MKRFVFSIILVLSVFVAFTAQAQLTVYDDFSGPFVDTARWAPRTLWGDDVSIYEGGFRILKGKLSFFNRTYGAVLDDDATQNMRRQLFLRNAPAAGVTSIETSIQMVKNGHEITGCAANPEPSETRVYIGGNFFNTGTVVPVPGNATGDIAAFIGFFKYSNSTTIPPGSMGVRARVRQCTNSDCSTYNDLHETLFNDLLIKVGKKTTLRITVDKNANTITFQVGKKIVDTYTYTVNDALAPGAINGAMRLEVAHYLANCPSTPRAVGWADVLFDYVSID
jgi:hypothetical protein